MDETTLPQLAQPDSGPRAELERSSEQLSSEVTVYAMDRVITHRDHVSSQGFGISTPLENTSHETTYHWKSRLHYEPQDPKSQEYIESSNANTDIEVLARNFADNYRQHQNPALAAKGEPSYSFSFAPSEEFAEELGRKFGADTTFRDLTPEEQEKFMSAFQKANEEAAKK